MFRVPLGVLGLLLLLAPAGVRGAVPPVAIASPATQVLPFPAPDRFTIELRPQASRAAFALRAATPARRLGLSSADRILASIPGAWIEPEFRGDSPPATEGSPDFAAFYIVHLPEGVNLDATLERFRALPEVRRANRIDLCPVTEVPNDSLWSIAYYFDQPSGRDIHAVEAWDLTHGDTSVVVAILDTGILPYHPDLAPFWTNPGEAGGLPGVDEDGNGYIDDLHGWDFVSLPNSAYATPGEDWQNEDNDPNDFVGHGTTVAGLIGALNDNRIGIAGTAWNVRIMPLRIGWSTPQVQTGVVDMVYFARALRYATRMRADVINISLSNTWTFDFQLAATAALDAGISLVVAAGNNGTQNALAGFASGSAVFVAATDRNDMVTAWSNRGDWVDLCAPGAEMATTVLARPGTDSLGLRQPSYVAEANGTSFSAPIVSGAVALLQGARRRLGFKTLDRRQIRTLLRATADDISAQNGGNFGYGTGRLDAERLVREGVRIQAVRMPRRTVGPGIAYTASDGRQVLAYAANDARLWRIDATTLDPLGTTPLPGPPTGGIAAAEVGTAGLGMFAGAASSVAGFDAGGTPLSGWPVAVPAGQVIGTPALGDLDGGGVPEVVAIGTSGAVLAWRAFGAPLPGFPVQLGPAGSLAAAPALTDLDGRPGVEVLVAAKDGTIHALGANGAELPGWPVVTSDPNPAAPVVTSRNGEIVVVVAGSHETWWLGADGRVLSHDPRTTWGAAADPALGDLDGDGEDDVLVPTATGFWAYHLDGTSLPGWPIAGAHSQLGSPVIGRVDGDAARDLLLMSVARFLALDASGQSIPDFPPYPVATAFPMFAGHGTNQSRIVLGSAADSTFFAFECPAPLDTLLAWPTPRGNAARTGSRLYSPVLVPDAIPPGSISDLRVEMRGSDVVALLWTAPGDDGPVGHLPAYDIRWLLQPITESNFAQGVVVVSGTPADPGAPDSVRITGLAGGVSYYFALRGRDEWSIGPLSNVASITTPVVDPAAVNDLRVTATTDTSVTLAWTATGDDGTVGRPYLYVVQAAFDPINDSNFTSAPYTRLVSATVDAGGTETLEYHPLGGGRTYWFALKAYDGENHSSPLSNVVSALAVDGTPPGAITDLRVEMRGIDVVSLLWTAPGDDGAAGQLPAYEVRWASQPITESNFTFGVGVHSETPASPGAPDSVRVTGLLEGVSCYFALRGLDGRNVGPISNVVSITMPMVNPAAVGDLRVTAATDSTVALAWTATGDDGTSGRAGQYVVRAALDPIDDSNFEAAPYSRTAIATVNAGGTETLACRALERGQRYWFALKAYDPSGVPSPLSNVVVITLPTVCPAAVGDLRATMTTDSSVTLAWTATGDDGTVGRARQYVVRAAPDPIDDASFDAAPYTCTVIATVDAGRNETLEFRSLERARHYWFALKAYDPGGNPSPLSNMIGATTRVGGTLDDGDDLALAPGRNPSRVPAALYWRAAPEAIGAPQRLHIFDLGGRKVRSLDLGTGLGGVATWDGRNDQGARVAAGLYVVRLASGSRRAQVRLVLLP